MPLAWSVALNLATTVLLAYVGVLVLRRHADGPASLALRMFATWWFAASAVLFLSGLHTLLALAGVTSMPVHLAVTYATAVPVAIALWGLLYYLLYIYTGRRSAIWPLTIAYGAFLLFELYYFGSFGDRVLETTPWNVRLVGDVTPPAGLSIAFAILLAVPVLAVVIGYGGLFFRLKEAEQRYRVGLVSAAFALWFGTILLGYVLGWDRMDWFPLVYETPGVAAALMIVAAYRPPRRVEAWLR